MKINYNIDHKLLSFPVFTENKFTTTERIITLIVFSQIVWFSKSKAGSCILQKNQLSKDLGASMKFFSKATSLLEKYKMIKCIRPYQRATNSPAVYITTGAYSSLSIKLWPSGHRPVAQGTQVNNYNNNYRENDSSYKESSPNAPVYRSNPDATTTWNETKQD